MESHFLNSVRHNKLSAVQEMLSESYPPDINMVDDRGHNALVIAIEKGHLDMARFLLEKRIVIGDALMHAIQLEASDAVEIICQHYANEPDEVDGSFTVGDIFPRSEDFMPTQTPLMFAARLNNYDVIQVLLDYGAKMPTHDDVLVQVEGKDQERAIATHQWYQAMCSSSYILLSSNDPIQTTFDMAHEIKHLKNKLPVMRDDYNKLRGQLEDFATKFLDFVRNGEEVNDMLSAGEDIGDEMFPKLLRRAASIDFKKFAAHGNCQEYLIGRWYRGGLFNWRTMSNVKFYFMSMLTLYLYPLPCIAYILSPWRRMEFLYTPYIRFLLHTSSRLSFLLLLVYTVTGAGFHNKDGEIADDTKTQSFILFGGTRPDTPSVLIYVWIFGMTWREMRHCYHVGLRAYWRRRFNRGAILQLVLYWIAMPFYLVPKVDKIGPTAESIFLGDSNSTTTPLLTDLDNILMAKKPTEYQLIAVSLFSIANVFTFGTVFHGLVIVNVMGPLQVSLGKMIMDILKFFILFLLVWLSFAVGLTQLYQVVEILDGQKHGFETVPHSMATLFWSLFSIVDLDSLKLSSPQPFIEGIGILLYACYMLLCPLILMTALVAMMSNTYTRVEENAETEWKVARTRLMGEYLAEHTTLPPPLNLIPTVRQILQLCHYFKECCHCKAGSRGLHPTSTEMSFLPQRPRRVSNANTISKFKIVERKLADRYILHLRTTLMKERHDDWVKTEILQLQKVQRNIKSELHGTCITTLELIRKIQEDMMKLMKDVDHLKAHTSDVQLKIKDDESSC